LTEKLGNTANSAADSSLIDDLRKIAVFADLSQEQLDWLGPGGGPPG
jgi:hypothetical protein